MAEQSEAAMEGWKKEVRFPSRSGVIALFGLCQNPRLSRPDICTRCPKLGWLLGCILLHLAFPGKGEDSSGVGEGGKEG